MSSFYEAFERKRAEDLMHYGVRGMKWGIVKDYKKAKTKQVQAAAEWLKRYGYTERTAQQLVDFGDAEKFKEMIMKEWPSLSEEEAREMAENDLEAANIYIKAKRGLEKEKKTGKYSLVPNLERMSNEIFSGKKVPKHFTIG